MAKDSKKLVQAITSQEENFAQWYTDICVKAELVEYSSVKGFIILRPYGQAIWELIQKDMDARFKATGHENVAMPVLIPESLLQNMVSLVGRTARRSSSLSEPPIVTHATSGAKPLTSSPSFCSRLSGISTGMATFSWPVASAPFIPSG